MGTCEVPYPVEVVRVAERGAMEAVPEGALMQRAAAGLAAECARLLRGGVYGSRVVVLAGSGDNGGDALYAGAWLARRGARVDVLAAAKIHERGWTALRRPAGGAVAGAEGTRCCSTRQTSFWTDCWASAAGRAACAGRRLAVARTRNERRRGRAQRRRLRHRRRRRAAVRAAVTVTFGAYKPGCSSPPARTTPGRSN